MSARSFLARAARAAKRRLRPPRAQQPSAPVRRDSPRQAPVPPLRPFPAGKVIFAVDVVPRVHAGRTASILTKARLFREKAGQESVVVTFYDSSQIEDIAHDFEARGSLVDGVSLASLHDFFPDDTEFSTTIIEHPVDVVGWSHRRDPATGMVEYFENGVHAESRRFDHAGRLIVRDYFNGARTRTRSDEYWPNGVMRRQVFMDLYHGVARQEILFRHDGTPRLNVWWAIDPVTRVRSPERVTIFDADGRGERVLRSYDEVLHACLDSLIGDEPAFLCVEARRIDPWVLTYHRPNVKKIFVLHNAHTRPPYDNVHRIRPIYRPLLEGGADVDAVVFLTEAQRAEAEEHFGKRGHFHVLPHSAPPSQLDPAIGRDPHRIVMMARLDQQKRLPHAIQAFSQIVGEFPGARLEIYGRGADEGALRALIRRLGLTDSVILAGYTESPARVYQSAGVSLLTSAYEGFGLAVLESLSNGCPVISYDLKYGPSDIITHGVNGFLVPNGDIRALAAQLRAYLRDPQLMARMSAAAPQAAEAFSQDAFVARWSALFNELSSEGNPTPQTQP